VSRTRLAVVEPAVFEMAAPIQSPAKCEVRSVISFLNAKSERPAEIHKQILAVYGNVMNRQNVTKWCREFSEGRTDVHDEQSSGRPSLISDDLLQEIEGEIRANRSVTIRELHHIIPAGKKFDDDDAVQEEVMTCFKGQAADFYDSGIQKLVPRLNKCLDNAGMLKNKAM
jgi:hypothetical protein